LLYTEIETQKIDPNPFYTRRVSEERVVELANSMKECGLLSPIRVRRKPKSLDRFELVFGHQRLTAARNLNWKLIKAEIASTSDEEMVSHALVENVSREGFCDFEKAKLLHKLKREYGWTNERLARSLGKSLSYVTQHLLMLKLLVEDLSELEADEEKARIMNSLTEHHARILSRLPNFKDRKEAAKLVVLAKLGVRETDRLVSRTLMNGKKLSASKNSTRKKMELQSIIDKLVRAYESKSFMEIAKLRHESKFSLFDDIPPFERLDYWHTISHVAGIFDKMKDIRVLIDGLQINTFRNFAILTFYLRFDSLWDEKPFRILSRVSLVLLHESKEWKIVHEHWSPMSFHSLKFLDSISEDVHFDNLPLSPKHSINP
jgi:ParB/RepB/Spo0J family partition protein